MSGRKSTWLRHRKRTEISDKDTIVVPFFSKEEQSGIHEECRPPIESDIQPGDYISVQYASGYSVAGVSLCGTTICPLRILEGREALSFLDFSEAGGYPGSRWMNGTQRAATGSSWTNFCCNPDIFGLVTHGTHDMGGLIFLIFFLSFLLTLCLCLSVCWNHRESLTTGDPYFQLVVKQICGGVTITSLQKWFFLWSFM